MSGGLPSDTPMTDFEQRGGTSYSQTAQQGTAATKMPRADGGFEPPYDKPYQEQIDSRPTPTQNTALPAKESR